MAIKAYKPTTPGRRGMTTDDQSMITAKSSKKSLLKSKKQKSGRNNSGRITVRHRGGGVKRHLRLIDYRRAGLNGTVEAIEYDPNRSSRIALVKDTEDNYHYVIAGAGMKVGQKIESSDEAPIKKGNRLALKSMPAGTFIYNVELTPGKGGQMVRSAGTSAQLVAKEGKYGTVRLPSGETRLVNLACEATIGAVGNDQHQNIKVGTAGRTRRKGRRPQVRGKVMNAVDHPHGGGDGGAHGVGRIPKTPWGQKTLGYKTRRRKTSDKFVVRTRHESKRR